MKTKRFLSIALTLVMLLGMFSGLSLTASAAGTTKTITPGTDDAKTGTGTMTITLIIKGDPAATDFDVTLPTSLAYDGTAKTASAAAKSTVTGMGTITVEYYKDGTKVDSAIDVGEYTVKLEVADDGTHYNAGTVESTDWKFTITKGTPTVTAPTAKGLTYTGSAQELVNAGSTNDGKLYYAVTTENKAPTDENLYTTSIPTATDAGTYYVWYKVKGDANHNDTGAAGPITVQIEKADQKVPLSRSGDSYASPEDNLAPVSSSGKIKKLELDFSNVAGSKVAPSDLKMTVISGSRFTTRAKLKDKDSAKATGKVKVKVNKNTLIPKITCTGNGSVTLAMEDGSTYTISFTVQKPKAQKSAKSISKGSSTVIKTINELFGTDIDAGDLTVQKQKHSQAKVSDNSLYIDPKEKDSIKLQYKYLDKKYKLTMKVK